MNHLPPYYGPRMQTRMRERSQKYACRGTSLDIRTYGRALRAAAAGPGTHPKKQATERSRRRPERARNARPLAADAARKKLDAPSAAARRRPGPAGCARPSWPSRGRPPRMRAPPAAVPPWPGRFQRLTRGASSGRPTRGRRGRATRRRTCGARPPEARAGATEPRTRLGGRHTARRAR